VELGSSRGCLAAALVGIIAKTQRASLAAPLHRDCQRLASAHAPLGLQDAAPWRGARGCLAARATLPGIKGAGAGAPMSPGTRCSMRALATHFYATEWPWQFRTHRYEFPSLHHASEELKVLKLVCPPSGMGRGGGRVSDVTAKPDRVSSCATCCGRRNISPLATL